MNAPGYADFAALVDRDFVMQLPAGGQVPLLLTGCSGKPDAFSLIFKAGVHAPREQGLYQLSSDGLGPLQVFLVPVALRPHDSAFPLEYEAIFNCTPAPGGST